jgi:hypothetical protein
MTVGVHHRSRPRPYPMRRGRCAFYLTSTEFPLKVHLMQVDLMEKGSAWECWALYVGESQDPLL